MKNKATVNNVKAILWRPKADLLELVKEAAKNDERSVNNWLTVKIKSLLKREGK